MYYEAPIAREEVGTALSMLYIWLEIAAGTAKWLKISQLEHLCPTAQFISFYLRVSLGFCILRLFFPYLNVSTVLGNSEFKIAFFEARNYSCSDLCEANIESLNTIEKTRSSSY